MDLYLIRHGDSLTGKLDDERPLSNKGKLDIQRLADFITPLHLSISQILCSKKLRALQTAKILSSAVQPINNIETRFELDPLAPVNSIMKEVYAQEKNIMLVGHMPFMGKLLSTLVVKNELQDIVSFNTASMVCLEHISHEQWVICWMLNSELLT